MSLQMKPGDALAIRINAHREGWDGTICDDPTSWSCLATPDFRERYCARARPDCFHLSTFARRDPSVVIEANGGAWIFERDPHAFDDQLLVLWTERFEEPRGVVRERPGDNKLLAGVYRVQGVESFETGNRVCYRVRPHPGTAVRLSPLGIEARAMRYAGGAYVKAIDRSMLFRLFEEAREEAEGRPDLWFSPADREQFEHFDAHLHDWCEIAARRYLDSRAEQDRVREVAKPIPGSGYMPFADLGTKLDPEDLRKAEERRQAERHDHRIESEETRRAAVNASDSEATSPESTTIISAESTMPWLVEAPRRSWVIEQYGERVLQALLLGALTKSLIVLRGEPGVGKSHLAIQLLEDPKRERTLIVPVSSTWRGSEDLLGYVNPVDNRFEETPFTRFLIDAELAWDKGDQRMRVVVFEEFNLSQPEHWFADVLSLTQFENRADRVIRLGNSGLRSAPNRKTVTLSPHLRFVATINSDHAARPLSPRVLDRAAVLELRGDPRRAIERAGIELEEFEMASILELSDALHGKDANFSLRSARALLVGLEAGASMQLERHEILDLVLVQDVLGKVRLLARDPADALTIRKLEAWGKRFGSKLSTCNDRIDSWIQELSEGRDVVQA
ncbi:MAG: AAA family ATPase [Planctomycetes bacterium]|nr:AAA family ATPase [Planctomycetota bacterium]